MNKKLIKGNTNANIGEFTSSRNNSVPNSLMNSQSNISISNSTTTITANTNPNTNTILTSTLNAFSALPNTSTTTINSLLKSPSNSYALDRSPSMSKTGTTERRNDEPQQKKNKKHIHGSGVKVLKNGKMVPPPPPLPLFDINELDLKDIFMEKKKEKSIMDEKGNNDRLNGSPDQEEALSPENFELFISVLYHLMNLVIREEKSARKLEYYQFQLSEQLDTQRYSFLQQQQEKKIEYINHSNLDSPISSDIPITSIQID